MHDVPPRGEPKPLSSLGSCLSYDLPGTASSTRWGFCTGGTRTKLVLLYPLDETTVAGKGAPTQYDGRFPQKQQYCPHSRNTVVASVNRFFYVPGTQLFRHGG